MNASTVNHGIHNYISSDVDLSRVMKQPCFLHMRNGPEVIKLFWGERTGLVVRASDSGSGDPGSILGRVGVLFPRARDIYSPKVLVIPRNRWLRLNMTEKLFTGTLNNNQKKKKKKTFFMLNSAEHEI